jgi:hypothetical protein
MVVLAALLKIYVRNICYKSVLYCLTWIGVIDDPCPSLDGRKEGCCLHGRAKINIKKLKEKLFVSFELLQTNKYFMTFVRIKIETDETFKRVSMIKYF